MKTINILIIAILFSLNSYSQTPGVLDFNYTTLAKTSSNFSPWHVLATWIESDAGVFIKTLKLNGEDRKEYLYTWNTKSSGNTTDASTGATLSSHTSHSLSWDITGTDGNLVPDGSYKIITEFTSEHSQGPLLEVSFSKTVDEISLQPNDETYFNAISLSFVPESSTSIENQLHTIGLDIYPNPTTDNFTIQFNLTKTSDIKVSVYDSKMSLIENIYSGHKEKGKIEMLFKLNDYNLSQGIYYILIKSDTFQSARKIILSK